MVTQFCGRSLGDLPSSGIWQNLQTHVKSSRAKSDSDCDCLVSGDLGGSRQPCPSGAALLLPGPQPSVASLFCAFRLLALFVFSREGEGLISSFCLGKPHSLLVSLVLDNKTVSQ